MKSPPSPTAAPIPAACVAVVRLKDDQFELLYLKRNRNVRAAPSTWVFPGGKLEAGDWESASEEEHAAQQAAVRETREESALVLDPSQLRSLYRWTTPDIAPRRFATWYFVSVQQNLEQTVVVDQEEIVEALWVHPATVLDRHRRGEMSLAVPAYVLSLRLAQLRTAAQARTEIDSWTFEVMDPRSLVTANGRVALYQGDAGWEERDPDLPGPRHRLYLNGSDWDYQRD